MRRVFFLCAMLFSVATFGIACSPGHSGAVVPRTQAGASSLQGSRAPLLTQANPCFTDGTNCPSWCTGGDPYACGDGTGITGGGGGGGSGGSGSQVIAVYTSPPVDAQKCGNNPGSGYGYHDNLGTFSNGVPEDVQNVNEVYVAAANIPFANSNGQLAIRGYLVGWFYSDQNSNVYFQANPNNGWYASYSVGGQTGNLALGVTFSQIPSTKVQELFKPDGTPLTALAPLPSGTTLAPCWSTLGTMLPKIT